MKRLPVLIYSQKSQNQDKSFRSLQIPDPEGTETETRKAIP